MGILKPIFQLLYFYLLFTSVFFACGSKLNRIEIKNDSGLIIEVYHIDSDSLRQGESIHYFSNGFDIFERSFYVDGKLEGKRTIYYQNGLPEIVEHYVQNKIHDTFQTYYPNGKLELEGRYDHGVLNGIVKKYYDNGSLMEEVMFENNEENGPFREFYPNEVIHWKGTYLYGDNEFGELLEYSESGILIKKMVCDSLAVCKTIWTLEKGDIAPLSESVNED